MTKEEFTAGWKYLIIQPWGRLYNRVGAEADIQAELYFDAVQWGNLEAWIKTCKRFAAGDHWPTIDELKAALQAYQPLRKKLPDGRAREPMPDDVRKELVKKGYLKDEGEAGDPARAIFDLASRIGKPMP